MFKNAHLSFLFTITKIMPIPLFLVYDGFEKVLDAVMVYKQVNALVNQEEPNILAPFCIPSGMHAIYNPK